MYTLENSCPSKQSPQFKVREKGQGDEELKVSYLHGYPAYPTDVLSDRQRQVVVRGDGGTGLAKVRVKGTVRDSGQIILGGQVLKSIAVMRDGEGGEKFDGEFYVPPGLYGLALQQYLRDCVEGQAGSQFDTSLSGVGEAETEPEDNEEEEEEEETCDECDEGCESSDGGDPSQARSSIGRVMLRADGRGESTSGGSSAVRYSSAKRMKWSVQFGVFRGLSGVPAGRLQIAKQREYEAKLGRVDGLAYAHPLAATLEVPEGGVKNGEMVALCRGSGRLNYMLDASGVAFFPVGASQQTKTVLAPVKKMSRAAEDACALDEANYIRASYTDGSAAFFDLKKGQSLGFISSEGKELNSEQALQYLNIMRDEEGTIRQIWNAWDGLADIVEVDENDPSAGYSIRIYPPAQVEEPSGEGELFTATGEPVRVFTVRGNDEEYSLRIAERDMTLPESMGEYVTTWKWAHEAWSQTTGEGAEAVERHREATQLDETHYSVVESLRKNDVEALRTYEEYEKGITGNLLRKRIVGYEHAGARTTTYEYNDMGQLIKTVDPGGGVSENVYDQHGRPTVQSSPWRETDVQNYHTEYRGDKDVYSTEPIRTEHTYDKPGEVGIALTEEYTYTEQNHVKRVEKRTRCEANTLLSVEETWLADAPGEFAAGRIKMEQAADGTQTHYSYAAAAGKYNALYSVTAEMRDEEGKLVVGQSTRRVSYVTEEGNTVREESYVLAAEDHWQLTNGATMEYDVLNRRIATRWDNGRSESQVLTCQGEPLRRVDADGVVTTYAYDSARQLIETTRSAVYDGDICITPETITEYERDAAGHALKTTEHIGALTRSTSMRYDLQGRVIEQTDALGRITSFAYSEDGLTTTVTTPGGAEQITRHNPDGTIAEESGSGQRHLLYAYDYAWGIRRTTFLPDGVTKVQVRTINALNQRVLLREATSLGNATMLDTRRTYNAKGQLVREKVGPLAPTTFAYDGMGTLSCRTTLLAESEADDPTKNRISKFQYSFEVGDDGSVYRVTTMERSNVAGEWLTSVQRELISQLSPAMESKTAVTDEYGKTTTTWTDYGSGSQRIEHRQIPTSSIIAEAIIWDGFVTSDRDNVGIENRFTRHYGDRGVTFTATDGRGNTTTTTTDIIERTIKTENAAGDTTTTEYCPWNNEPAVITDALGFTACAEYDSRNRKVAEFGTGVQPVVYEYDDANRLVAMTTWRDAQQVIATDPRGMEGGDITRWEYDDASGLELKKIYADGQGNTMTYNNANRPATLLNARGVLTTYAYNSSLGVVNKITYSDAPDATLTVRYNIAGKPLQIKDAAGTHTFTYNRYDLQETESRAVDGAKFTLQEAYDEYGRSVGFSLLKGGSAVHTVSTGYAQDGRIATAGFRHANSDRTCHFAYLAGSNLLAQLTLSNGMTLSQTWEEKRDLLTEMNYMRGGTLVTSRSYEYDPLARPTSRSTYYPGKQHLKLIASFGYNDRSELTAAKLDASPYAYAYDNIGNRITAQEDAESVTYETNELNQYTLIKTNGADFTPDFDADGNQTLIQTSTGIWRVTYNAQNRATRYESADGSTIITCVYDYMGRRVRKQVVKDGVTMLDDRFFYRGYLQVAAYDWLPVTKTSRCFLVWDPTQSVATRPLAIRTGGTAYTYGWDLTKNICELYGPNGYIVNRYAYTPFGSVTQTEGSVNQPFTWSSEYHDTETGLVYYNYRYYNPHDSRWTRRDPIGERASYSAYGNAAPFVVDIFGLYAVLCFAYDAGKIIAVDRDNPTDQIEVGDVFSGNGDDANNPNSQHLEDRGPIPEGEYWIGKQRVVHGREKWRPLYGDDGGGGKSYTGVQVYDPNTGQRITRGGFNLHVGTRSNGCVTVTSEIPEGSLGYPQSGDYDRLNNFIEQKGKRTPFHNPRRDKDTYHGVMVVVRCEKQCEKAIENLIS